MNFKNSKVLKFIVVLLLTTFIIGFIVLPFIIEGKAFVVGMDVRSQYRPFYSEFRNLIIQSVNAHSLPFWSWNLFYGNNFWSGKMYYMMTDIFSYISLFFNNHYYYLFMMQTVLKIFLSVFTFYLYCNTRKFKFTTSLILSLCWGFSSWALYFVCQPIFLYFYSLVPLYFIGIEYFLQNKRKYIFSIVTGLLIVSNFYLFYTLSIFTLVYCFYRYFEINNSLKGVLKCAGKMIFYYVIGILCSMIIIYPAIINILGNTRIGANSTDLFKWNDLRIYMNLLISWIYPTNVFVNRLATYNGSVIFSSIFNTDQYTTVEILFYSGCMISLLVFNSLFDKDKKYRILNRSYFLFIVLAMFLPIISSALHGFSQANFRWSMFAIFINLMITARYLDNHDFINKKVLIYTVIFYIILIVLDLPITALVKKYDFLIYLDQYYKMLLIIPFIIFISISLQDQKYRYYTIILTVLELILSSYLTYNDNIALKQYDWKRINANENVLGSYGQFDYYVKNKLEDYGFYRVYASYNEVYWYYSLNMNLVYGFQGVSTYDTTYNYSLDDLLLISDIDKANGWTWNVKQPDILDFASVKYAFVTSEDQLPDDNYTYIDEYYGILLYQNNNYRSVANTYYKLITYDQYAAYEDPSMITSYIICHDSDYANISNYLHNNTRYSAENVYADLNHMYFNIKSDSSSFIVTSVAYDKGWKVLVDGKQVKTYKINGGFIGFGVDDAGDHEINMYFVPTGFKTGIYLSIGGIFVFLCLVSFEEIMIKRNKKKIVEII